MASRKTAGTTATRKAPARKVAAAPAKKPVAAPVASRPATKPRTAPVAKKPKPVRAATSDTGNEPPVQHITQEEAVAHIQALLDAKRERDRQGPNWPTGDQHAAGTPDAVPGSGSHPAPKAPSPEASQPNMAHERGDQQKAKG
ncbi:hypothetical protein [Luteibacter yeojuensis]|uniref:hypothetical protein n=1 Tax=Luteibacter yeojuensis TaxID=345309 RepID=UPI00308433D8